MDLKEQTQSRYGPAKRIRQLKFTDLHSNSPTLVVWSVLIGWFVVALQEEDKKGEEDVDDAAGNGAGKAPGNLFTSKGLQVSYRDLEQNFDNSDDTSSDEAVREKPYITR